MTRPFTTPSNADELYAELKTLREGLVRISEIKQLNEGAAPEETRNKLNELLAALSSLTRAGNVRRI